MGLRDEHGAPRSVPIAVWILRALVTAARRARLKMDSEGGFLGDKRLVVVAIAIIDARVFQAIPTQRTIEIENSVRGGQHAGHIQRLARQPCYGSRRAHRSWSGV